MTSFSYNDYSYNLNNKKNRIFCNNCGNYGHLFHNCKKPITSIGIICFRINKIKNNQVEYLMVQRKDSMGYVDILRGKYNIHNNFHIKNILNEITHTEKQNIINFNYKQLWIKLWDITDSDEISKINSNKNNNETKFEHLKKNPIFINHNTKYSEPEWGFPKEEEIMAKLISNVLLENLKKKPDSHKMLLKFLKIFIHLKKILLGLISNHININIL